LAPPPPPPFLAPLAANTTAARRRGWDAGEARRCKPAGVAVPRV
jgi:hypothetical protein